MGFLQVSGEKVDVTGQLVKPDYLVVSLPRRKPANPPTLGFLSTKVCATPECFSCYTGTLK